MRFSIKTIMALVVCCIAGSVALAGPRYTTRVLGEGSEYSTTMYIYDSGKPGKDFVVVGGIHLPKEESGTTVFQAGKPLDLETLSIDQGRLFVIPAFNERRIVRSIVDMNRFWKGELEKPNEGNNALAQELFSLIKELHEQGNLGFVLDLHEGFANSLGNSLIGGGAMGARVVEYLNSLPEIEKSVAGDSKRFARPFRGAFVNLASPIMGAWTRSAQDLLGIPAAELETTGQSNSGSPEQDSLALREFFIEKAVKFIAAEIGMTISVTE